MAFFGPPKGGCEYLFADKLVFWGAAVESYYFDREPWPVMRAYDHDLKRDACSSVLVCLFSCARMNTRNMPHRE